MRFSVLLLALLPLAAAGQKIYKHVGEDGSVTYSDEPMVENAVAMDLPEISVVGTRSSAPPARASGAGEAADADEPVSYQGFQLLAPAPDETFFAAQGPVPVNLDASRPLAAGHLYRVFMDGRTVAETSNPAISLQNVNRGAHVVYAEIFDPAGQVLARTQPVTFYFRQPSVFQPGRRGGGA